MIAFKINSAERKVEQIEINTWQDIAPAIGNECTMFACPVTFENEDTIYVDDEGLYHLAMKCGDYQTFCDCVGSDAVTGDGVRYNEPAVNVVQLNSDVFDL